MPVIIRNRWLPLKGFSAINILGLVLVRRGVKVSPVLINHEQIHTRQQIELLVVGFYLWYIVEWLYWLVRFRNNALAYRAISFEREAYQHERDMRYLSHRQRLAWLRQYRCPGKYKD